MLRFLLILTVTFSLTQSVSAERWRGLIASVAALEAAREPSAKVEVEVLTPKTKVEIKTPILALTQEYKRVCTNGLCRLVPVSNARVSVKVAKSLVTKRQPRKVWRFRLFRRSCSTCK